MILDIQRYLNAPTQLDAEGNYTYILNPDTGKWEIAYGGFANPATFTPQVTQGAYGIEYVDSTTGRLVTQNENATGMEWVYADDWTPAPGQQQSGFALPKSVAEQVAANPDAYSDVLISGVGPVQQNRGTNWISEGDWMVAAPPMFFGATIPGFGPWGIAESVKPGITAAMDAALGGSTAGAARAAPSRRRQQGAIRSLVRPWARASISLGRICQALRRRPRRTTRYCLPIAGRS